MPNNRIVKWSASTVGKDPNNPLVDLYPEDSIWYFNTLVDMTAAISTHAQIKDEFVWEQLTKRRPKQLHKGKTKRPNSVLSTATGLLTNYIENTAKYGHCRISKKQMEDFEYICLFFHALDEDRFATVQWQQSLFSIDGTMV